MVKKGIKLFEEALKNPRSGHRRIRESSIVSYIKDVNRLIVYCKTDKPGEKKIQEYIDYLYKNGVGPRSIAKYIAAYRKYYLLILKKDLDIVAPEYLEPQPAWFNLKEMKNLFHNSESLKNECIIRIGYACALRIHEVRLIDVEHIDFQSRLLKVYGKGARIQISLPIDSIITTRKIREYIDKDNITAGSLFPGKKNGRLCETTINRAFQRELNRIDIKKRGLTFHSLRHSKITHLLEQGWNLRELQDFARHKNINTTARYLHLVPMHLKHKAESNIIDF